MIRYPELVPAGLTWSRDLGSAMNCRARWQTGGPLACYGQNVRDFGAMAIWSGQNLDEDPRVFARKPRLFYVFSGLEAATYPFSTSGDSLMVAAEDLGIDYVVRGTWDRATPAYVDPAIRDYPSRFCRVAQLQSGDRAPTYLLAIRDESPEDPWDPEDSGLVIPDCLHDQGWVPPSAASIASKDVPILNR